MRLQELQFQMAVRDQVISEQRDVISNLWRVIEGAGLNQQQIQAIALEQGIVVEGLAEGSLPGSLQKAVEKSDLPTANPITPQQQGRHVPALPLANQSIYGARAQYRYDFWQNYDGPGGVDGRDFGDLGQYQGSRPSTSQSDHDMRYSSPEPRRSSTDAVGSNLRGSSEHPPSGRKSGKESKVGAYSKASPAKSVRSRRLPPTSVQPQQADHQQGGAQATAERDRRKQQLRSSSTVQHGRRQAEKPPIAAEHSYTGPGMTAAERDRAEAGPRGNQKSEGQKPVASAWAEEGPTDLFVGPPHAANRDREREAVPVGGGGPGSRLASQLGRLKGRLMSRNADKQPQQQPHSDSSDLGALRIEGSTTGKVIGLGSDQMTSREKALSWMYAFYILPADCMDMYCTYSMLLQSQSESTRSTNDRARRAQFERLKGRGSKPGRPPAVTTYD